MRGSIQPKPSGLIRCFLNPGRGKNSSMTRFVDNYSRWFKAEAERGEEHWEVAILTADCNASKDLIPVPLSIGDSEAAEGHEIEVFKEEQKELREQNRKDSSAFT